MGHFAIFTSNQIQMDASLDDLQFCHVVPVRFLHVSMRSRGLKCKSANFSCMYNLACSSVVLGMNSMHDVPHSNYAGSTECHTEEHHWCSLYEMHSTVAGIF